LKDARGEVAIQGALLVAWSNNPIWPLPVFALIASLSFWLWDSRNRFIISQIHTWGRDIADRFMFPQADGVPLHGGACEVCPDAWVFGQRRSVPLCIREPHPASTAAADAFAANVLPIIRQIQDSGVQSFRGVARALTARGIKTARGGQWSAAQVSEVVNRPFGESVGVGVGWSRKGQILARLGEVLYWLGCGIAVMLFACGTLLYALQPVALFIGGLKKTIWQKPTQTRNYLKCASTRDG
jgi:hypothetical protein